MAPEPSDATGPSGPFDPADPFGTAALRAAVLQTWSGSPTRFREDANAEEDLLLGGYADAWCIELAQNAADAALAAGVPGRLAIELDPDGPVLRVANTGAPLDAAGVAALASLRASAKRDDEGSVGRFGVGFAAVLAVSRAPRVVTGRGTGVRFSAADTAAAVGSSAGPAAELARRGGQLPVLRLVWPVDPDEPAPPPGYDTEVRLPLADGVDPALLLATARAGAPDLLLALPGLTEITVDGVTLARTTEPSRTAGEPDVVRVGDRRWLLAVASGTLGDEEAGAQAAEQRARRDWSLRWALPVDADGRPVPLTAADGEVLHAPTAGAEGLSLPARLIATVALEPDRRRVRDGPATRRVLAATGPAYLDLVRAVAPVDRIALVPVPGFPRSEVDATVRAAVLDALRTGCWLPAAGGGPELAPQRSEWLDVPGAPGLAALLADVAELGALVDPDVVAAAPAGVLAELGVRRLGAGELVDRLLGLRRPPTWWHAVYAALAPAVETVPGLAEELRGLPVPLAGGRTVAGPSSVLLPEPDHDPDDGAGPVAELAELALPGLHIAAAAAVHPLLTRLGAAGADPQALLDHPALRDAVERSVDDAEAGLDTRPLAAAVLGLVAAVDPVAVARHRWLGALALADEDGDPARADELVLPDAVLRPLLDPDAPVGVLDAALAARVPRGALAAVGVLDGFAVVVDEQPAGPDHDLHDEDLWWDGLAGAPARLVGVRDLDLVADDAWPAALALLGAERDTRAAVLAEGYTRWWLTANASLGGRRPAHWRLASADVAAALYDPAPAPGVDEAVLAAIGVRSGLVVTGPDEAADLLDRLADPRRTPGPALVAAAHAALADAVGAGILDPADVDPPERVRVLDGSVVAVDDVVVLDAPWLTAVLPAAELVAGGDPAALADLLDLPLASAVVDAAPVDPGAGRVVVWSSVVEVVVACHTLGVAVPDGDLVVHDLLTVDVRRPALGRRSVPAWPDATGRWHASDPLRALLGCLAPGPPGSDGAGC